MQADRESNDENMGRIQPPIVRMLCAGRITNPKSARYGKPCRRLLAMANSKGKLHARIKCPRCNFMNEV